MKKLIYTAAALLLTGSGVMAQTLIQGRPGHQEAPGMSKQSPVKNSNNAALGKADITDWYDPASWIDAFTSGGTTLQTFVDFLMPDSLAQYRDEGDTVRRFYNIAAGQVIDPKDDVIERTDNPTIRMSQFSRYTLDSFYLTYLYVRNVDTLDDGSKIADTLIVSYLTSANLTRSTLDNANPPFSIALPSWNINTLSLTSVAAQEKFVLTDEDSTLVLPNSEGVPESSWRMKQMIKKVGPAVSVPASVNNYVGMVFQFKPGMPYDTGSIMIYQQDPSTFPTDRKRVNYFGFRFTQNTAEVNAQWRSREYVNHSLFSDKENAYYPFDTAINNGWTGFIPGNAYFQGRNIFSGVKVSAQGVGLADKDVITISSMYPNPANGSTNVSFNLKKSAKVKMSVINIVGQEVTSSDAGFMNAGNNTISLNLNGLKAGVYFVNISVDGASTTKKLTITE